MRRIRDNEKTYTYFSVDGTAIVIAAGEDGITEDHILLLQSFHRMEQNNSRKAQRHQLSLERLIENTDDQSITLIDTKVDMDRNLIQQMDEKCLRDKLSAAWGLLLPQQRELLMKVHVQRKTLTSIAHDEGVALQTVQDRLKRIYKKIKKIIK